MRAFDALSAIRLRIDPPIEKTRVSSSGQSEGRTIIRITRYSSFQQQQRRKDIIGRGKRKEDRQGTQIGVVSREVECRPPPRAANLVRLKRRFYDAGNAGGDLVL